MHRVITGGFGALLVVLAVLTVILVEPALRWRAVAVALVLAFLGVDAIVASVRGRTAIVSRIGPLP
jgi:uncharacterized membrane protein YqjE